MKILAIIFLLGLVLSKPSVLVVLDSWATKDTHSFWFSKLREKFDLTLKFVEEKFQLMNFDEANYDHVMVIAPSISTPESSFSEESLLEFFDAGHSILMLSDTITKKF